MARIELPPDYMRSHFAEFLQRVSKLYQPLFDAATTDWIASYHGLSVEAQRLWLRMLSRKGLVFALADLQYAEVTDQAAAVQALTTAGFISPAQTAQTQAVILERLTKARLWQLVELLPDTVLLQRPKKSADRPSLLAYVQAHPALSIELLQQIEHWVVLHTPESLQFLLFLHFGHLHTDLSAFVLRDLGVLPTQPFKQDFAPRYLDAATAQVGFFYASRKAAWRELLPKRTSRLNSDELQQWVDSITRWPTPLDERTELQREQLCYEIGRQAERLQHIDLALQCYRHEPTYPASERLMRLYHQLGDTAALEQQLQQMLQQPSCDDEYQLAQDFSARLGRVYRITDLTQTLQQAGVLTLDDLYMSDPEQGVIQYYQQQGQQAWHCENNLWQALFGLWFWQELFESDLAAVHSEFDWRPRDLTTGLFYTRQQAALDAKLALFATPEQALRQLLKQFAHAAQRPNALFRFYPELLEQLQLLVQHAPAGALASLLKKMAQDYRSLSRGFPDLLVRTTQGIEFIEVKAPGDVLRRHQLTRLRTLQDLGFAVRVQKLKFFADPKRIYAVVDVETTGGTGSADRITEIAIVRVQQGQVIDRYSQLVNPQRRIPSFITRLTGISDAMVAAQPSFAEIAGDVLQRLQGCVFVAHNVKFDYGFVKAELARCDLELKLPQLCTVVQSRKSFPGLASYGLAALASHFGLNLTQHHRALADAAATAELLLLIQQQQALSTAPHLNRQTTEA